MQNVPTNSVNPKQIDYQKIVGRENSSRPLKTVTLTTVTYGTACAAFLATRSLKQLAIDECEDFPIASKTVIEDFYVAALLLSKLIRKVCDSIRMKHNTIELWSDSKIVLAWLRKSPAQMKVYVANRVANIQELTSELNWNYIPTKSNPTDIISRGQYPSELRGNRLWWNGPHDFISNSVRGNEINETTICESDLPEMKVQSLSL